MTDRATAWWWLPVLAFLVGAAGCTAQAKRAQLVVGVYQFAANDELDRSREGFLAAMKEAGYRNGENVEYRFENANADLSTATLVAKKLADPATDLIFTAGTPALQTCINEVKDGKPIVFSTVANPYILGAGKTAEDHLPNVTGASATSPILETMELMREAIPSARVVGIVHDPANANSAYNLQFAQECAGKLGLRVKDVAVSSSSEVLTAAQSLAAANVDVLYQIPDHVVRESSDSLVKVADEFRIPLVSSLSKMAEEGAALTVGWDYFDNGYLAGKLAARVLKGESPASIPFQPLRKKQIAVNRAAAARQGLPLPKKLLEKADTVY